MQVLQCRITVIAVDLSHERADRQALENLAGIGNLAARSTGDVNLATLTNRPSLTRWVLSGAVFWQLAYRLPTTPPKRKGLLLT